MTFKQLLKKKKRYLLCGSFCRGVGDKSLRVFVGKVPVALRLTSKHSLLTGAGFLRQGKEIGVSPEVDFMLLNICGAATRWRWELGTMTQTVVTSKGKAHVPVRKMRCQCETFTSFSIYCFLFFHVFFFTLSFLLWCKRFYGPLTSHISKWRVPDWNLLLYFPPFHHPAQAVFKEKGNNC